MQEKEASYLAENLLDWYAENARDLPWRKTRDPYAVWISEVMLQQTQVIKVIEYWKRWMVLFPSIKDLALAESDAVLKAWEGLGYYSRCKNLKRAAQVIVNDFDGEFPSDPDLISSLPGIGPYTTGAIASIAFNKSLPLVDGNVERIMARFLAFEEDVRLTRTKKKIWDHCNDLIQFISHSDLSQRKEVYGNINQALMELGATVCTPQKPKCHDCPIAYKCTAKEKGLQTKLPIKSKLQKTKNIFSTSFLMEWDGEILVERASVDQWNSGLYQFPTIQEEQNHSSPEQLITKHWNLARESPIKTIGTLRHYITHHRINIRVLRIELTPGDKKRLKLEGQEWATMQRIRALPFSGAHLKILKMID